MRLFLKLLPAALAISIAPGALAQTVNDHALWNIRSEAGETRWLQIREVSRYGAEQIFHIDVYRRDNGDLEELAVRLVDHMAIEKEALLNSIGQAIEVGVPERGAYENALIRWVRQRPSERFICRSPIQRCMQNPQISATNDF